MAIGPDNAKKGRTENILAQVKCLEQMIDDQMVEDFSGGEFTFTFDGRVDFIVHRKAIDEIIRRYYGSGWGSVVFRQGDGPDRLEFSEYSDNSDK